MEKRLIVLLFLFFTLMDHVNSANYKNVIDSIHQYYVIDKFSGDSLKVTYRKYMKLSPNRGLNAQGAACYGDYFVQGYDGNSCISFYNLKEKRFLSTIELPSQSPNSRIHANTLNFGTYKYKDSDYFPLLYVSSGYAVNGVSYIFVYRIIDKDKHTDFSISLVQTISLINFGKWTEGIIDTENNYLWVKSAKNKTYFYSKYVLPGSLKDEVSLFYGDSLERITLEASSQRSSGQGHLFHDNKILFVSGAPSRNQPLYLVIINAITGKRELSLDLAEVGLIDPNNRKRNSFEPESVIFYKDKLMICYRKALYILNIRKNENSNNIRNIRSITSRAY